MNLKIRNFFRLFDRIENIVILVAIAVNAPFLWFGVSKVYKAYIARENFLTTQGTVIGNEYIDHVDLQDSSRRNWAYYPAVRFSTPQNEFVFTDSVGTVPPKYEKGDVVDVLYNPDDPHDAMINTWSRVWLGPILSIAGPLLPILMAIGFAVWQHRQMERMFEEARRRRQRT